MCTDARKVTVWNELRQRDLKAFASILRQELVAQAAAQVGVALGRGALGLFTLVWLGLGCALHPCKNFADVLGLVLKLVSDGPAGLPRGQRQDKRRKTKHHPGGQDATTLSEEGFVQARRKLPWAFWTALVTLLAEDFAQTHASSIHWKQFRLLALDGTCLNLARWPRLTAFFGAAKGKKNGIPKTQARLVLLQFPLARITWRFQVTPVKESELSVAERLLTGLQANDLVLVDRGFWSFGLFWQIQNQRAFFATRLKAGIPLRTLKVLGRDDRLVCYQPTKRKWKKLGLPAAMPLRVIRYQIQGFRPSAVVTNVLDPQAISREEWVRLAAVDDAGRVLDPGLYHRRWEIETTFRELKVIQGLDGGLRGRTPESIRYEVAGHVLLHMLVHWLMVEAADKAGLADPLRLSFKSALNELLDMRQTLLQASAERVRRVLLPRLLNRIAQHRVPPRPGRHYSRPHDTKPKNKGRGQYQRASKLETKRT